MQVNWLTVNNAVPSNDFFDAFFAEAHLAAFTPEGMLLYVLHVAGPSKEQMMQVKIKNEWKLHSDSWFNFQQSSTREAYSWLSQCVTKTQEIGKN